MRDPAGTCSSIEGLADEPIDREWARTADDEGCEAGDIEQDNLITHRSELRARRGHGEDPDRAETRRSGMGDYRTTGNRVDSLRTKSINAFIVSFQAHRNRLIRPNRPQIPLDISPAPAASFTVTP